MALFYILLCIIFAFSIIYYMSQIIIIQVTKDQLESIVIKAVQAALLPGYY